MEISRDRLRLLAGAAAVFLISAVIYLITSSNSSPADFDCSVKAQGSVEIDVSEGESGSEIAGELYEKGVTASFDSFFRVAVGDKRSGRIAPGIHTLDSQLCATQALEQLLDSKRIGNLLAIREGMWNSEIKKSLVRIGYKQSEVSAAFNKVQIPAGFKSLEGLLFPANYSFESNTPVSKVLETMIQRSTLEIKGAGFFDSPEKFTPAQLLVIASLVQAEGGIQDFTKISQVIRNRLTKGMPLQFDSTVHYVQGIRGSIFLSTKSTLLNSAYNTYRRYGLPPGPINNPGAKALFAATHPEKGDWLYFITVAPGDTRFTDSLDEFNVWKAIYKKNLRAGMFGDQ